MFKKPAAAPLLKKPAGLKSAKTKAEKPMKANSPSTHHLAHPPCCVSPSSLGSVTTGLGHSAPPLGTVPYLSLGAVTTALGHSAIPFYRPSGGWEEGEDA